MSDNRSVYEAAHVVAGYRRTAQGLTPQEQLCVDMIPGSDRGSVLDIGVGGGRTTGALSALFRSYVGIDYSSRMVEATKALFPACDLRVMDARKLEFPGTFDCVVFSYNGIDSVSYDDREAILVQIAGVLRPGGHFLYSTHNLDYRHVPRWMGRLWASELATPLRRMRFFPRRLRNFWGQSLDSKRAIAYVNDPANDFALLNLYVRIPEELERLSQLGFRAETTIGNGKTAEGYDADDNWVYILARKP